MITGVNIRETTMEIANMGVQPCPEIQIERCPFAEKEDIIGDLIFSIGSSDFVVVTQNMCINRQLFSSAREGTHYIIDVTERLFGDKVRYLGLSSRLYTASEAREHYLNVACRNWVATCYLTSYLNLFEDGLVIDCGTNSTDIVPVLNSRPMTLDDNDQGYTRTRTGELLWSGLYFTHVPSISHAILLGDNEYQTNPSTRAMSFDIYVVLDMVKSEDVLAEFNTKAEYRRLISPEASGRRIMDSVSADSELLGADDARKIACYLAEKQREKTLKAIKNVLAATKKKYKTDLKTVALAGAGKDIIVRKALEGEDLEIIDLETEVSRAFDLKNVHHNCETSLGCALIGLEAFRNP